MTANNTQAHDSVRETVREGYAAVARGKSDSCCSGDAAATSPPAATATTGCCGGSEPDAQRLAQSIGYDAADLSALPADANLGLSCGNPIALASLQEGEVVLDLGAGGGFDAFIAGRRVGAAGRVIGVDMTPEMLSLARKNTAAYREASGLNNVEFRLGEIENLPVADASVNVVISNCVINLSPDKPRVYAEIARVLMPGGRVAISDIVLKKPLPEAIAKDAQALVGCVAGALQVDELRSIMDEAGFANIELIEKAGYVEAMTVDKGHIAARVHELLGDGETIGDYIASMNISATMGAADADCCSEPATCCSGD